MRPTQNPLFLFLTISQYTTNLSHDIQFGLRYGIPLPAFGILRESYRQVTCYLVFTAMTWKTDRHEVHALIKHSLESSCGYHCRTRIYHCVHP